MTRFLASSDAAVVLNAVQQILGSDIGGHDQDRIFKVYGTALGVGDTAVIEYLQQNVEDVRMRFLDLIEQNNRIWFSAHCLSQLAALLVAYISRRRSIRRETEYFSMYSLISIRTMLFSSSNSFSANVFASSVLPTPVGQGTGRTDRFVGSLIPALERMIASETLVTASFWPITLVVSSSSRPRILVLSPSVSFATGIPVSGRQFWQSLHPLHSRVPGEIFIFNFFSSASSICCNFGEFTVLQFSGAVQIVIILCFLDLAVPCPRSAHAVWTVSQRNSFHFPTVPLQN